MKKKETNPILFPHSFCYRQVTQPVQVFNLGNSLQVIKDTPLLKFHNFIIHDIHFYILLFFATLGDMIPWLRLRPENWPAYEGRYRKGKVSVIYSHSMQRTQSRLLRVSSRALTWPTTRDRDSVNSWPKEASWQTDLPANSPLVSYLIGSENT